MNNKSITSPGPEHRHYSVGAVAQTLQINLPQLYVLAEEGEIEFSMMVDGVPYLDGINFEKARVKVEEIREEINDFTKQVAESN